VGLIEELSVEKQPKKPATVQKSLRKMSDLSDLSEKKSAKKPVSKEQKRTQPTRKAKVATPNKKKVVRKPDLRALEVSEVSEDQSGEDEMAKFL